MLSVRRAEDGEGGCLSLGRDPREQVHIAVGSTLFRFFTTWGCCTYVRGGAVNTVQGNEICD